MDENESQDSFMAQTHRVENQPPMLEDCNAYRLDAALQDSVRANGATWADAALAEFGALTGSAEYIQLGFQANENRPVLDTHDRHGYRVDRVRYHPAYHRLMKTSIEQGLHSSHWVEQRKGAGVARAAKFYLMTQAEAAHLCPVTMTSAAVPALKHQPELFKALTPKILATEYQPEDLPIAEKQAITLGMAMTEKQGGSDVRSNSTRAYAVAKGGPG